MTTFNTNSPPLRAFTLVEVLIVIAILGIMTSLVVTVYRSVAQDSRDVVARQQQAALQNALNNWVTGSTSRGKIPISTIRATYNGTANSRERLDLVQAYLDEGTYAHFVDFTIDNTKIQSEALSKVGKYITFADWTAGSFPQVKLLP